MLASHVVSWEHGTPGVPKNCSNCWCKVVIDILSDPVYFLRKCFLYAVVNDFQENLFISTDSLGCNIYWLTFQDPTWPRLYESITCNGGFSVCVFNFFFHHFIIYAIGYEDIYPLVMLLNDEINSHYRLILCCIFRFSYFLISSFFYNCCIFVICFSAIYDASAIISDHPVITVFIITIFQLKLQLYFEFFFN